MKIEKGAICLEKRELSDLLKTGAVEGPVVEICIEKYDSFWAYAGVKCYDEAVRIARKKNYPIFILKSDVWILGKASYCYEFYKFKFLDTASSSSMHPQEASDSH